MTDDVTDLIDWCRRARDEAVRQTELFGSGGVKAILQMPDGTTQDITDGVRTHQTSTIPVFDRLIAALTR